MSDVEPVAITRARAMMVWATCAPLAVAERLRQLRERPGLTADGRALIEGYLSGLRPLAPTADWCCRFPVVAEHPKMHGFKGGILTASAVDATVLPPAGSAPVGRVLDIGALTALENVGVVGLFVGGIPLESDAVLVGRSGTAAAWLAARARRTGRSIPEDVVVSADLVPGPGGEPCLAEVTHCDEKAEVVRKELPGCRVFVCGAHSPSEHVTGFAAGTPVGELERAIWGREGQLDRAGLSRVATVAKEAFEDQDYALAAQRYQELLGLLGTADRELRFEAALRLGSIAVHRGRPEDARTWFAQADAIKLPNDRKSDYIIERLASIAGMFIDAFDPDGARTLLESKHAKQAADPDYPRAWDRIQVLGSWRRLHLLEGDAEAARRIQSELLALAEGDQLPRALLDMGWTCIRCGDLPAAKDALRQARVAIDETGGVYRVQSIAFLTWYVGRLLIRGGDVGGLDDLLALPSLDAMLADASLQAAGRWRMAALRAVLARSSSELASVINDSADFQKWQVGAFLLEVDWARDLGRRAHASATVDLSHSPAHSDAVVRLAGGWDAEAAAVLVSRGVY